MTKDKNKGAVINHQLAVDAAKEHFLSLCLMYENMGRMFKQLAKATVHPAFAKSTIPVTGENLLIQYKEIGEEMKNIGESLDMCGGKPCMSDKKKTIKQMEKAHDETKVMDNEENFVSNIAPKDDKEDKEK